MARPLDIWRSAIVKQTVAEVLLDGIKRDSVVWLSEMRSCAFRADPFGLWRDSHLYVFAEAYDYRTRIGHIDVLVYDGALNLLETRPVLNTPWHLSYPFVFEAEGETWMLPEGYKSGTLTLYRARSFPDNWEAVCAIPLDGPAIDATPFWHDGRWWLFYAPSYNPSVRRSNLHVAWSDRLTGPWQLHPLNPVRVDLASTRPGGTPVVLDGTIILPVQDCRSTYGGAIRALSIEVLDETRFVASDRAGLAAPDWMAPFTEGCHTLAAAGPVTLIDVKRTEASLLGEAVRIQGVLRRRWRETRLLGRLAG
jgi:hypothetical protein